MTSKNIISTIVEIKGNHYSSIYVSADSESTIVEIKGNHYSCKLYSLNTGIYNSRN